MKNFIKRNWVMISIICVWGVSTFCGNMQEAIYFGYLGCLGVYLIGRLTYLKFAHKEN